MENIQLYRVHVLCRANRDNKVKFNRAHLIREVAHIRNGPSE
jgi:hypothetical protein